RDLNFLNFDHRPTSLAQQQPAAIIGLPLPQPLPSINSILTPEVVAACASNPALLNAVYSHLLAVMAASSKQQQLLNMAAVAAGSPPPLFPPQLLNPQTRAMLLAVLASAKPLPPSMLQTLPVAPNGQPRLNFPAPPGFPLMSNSPVIDPRLLLAAKKSLIRPSETLSTSPLIKVKPIVPFQGTSMGVPTFRNRREIESDMDEFAGLMTKRERGYMVNIQCIQVHTDDPYNDDYYWVMYKKRMAESGNGAKDSVNSVLSDLRDIHKDFEHRAYVAPDFQGSLGKLQSSSIACPRHLIDLRQNAAESNSSESRESPSSLLTAEATVVAIDQVKLVSLSKVNTNLLLDIENAYVEALKCDQYLVELQGYNQCELSDRIRENLSKIVWCTKNVASLIASDSYKLQSVLSSRKGRRLVDKILPFLQNHEMALLLNLFFESLFKKTNGLSDEAYSFFVKSLKETLDNSSELNWTELLDELLSNYSLVNRTSVNVRADCLLFILLFHCSLQNAKLSDTVQIQLVDHLRNFSSKIQLKEKQLFVIYVKKFIVDLDVKLNSLGAYFRSEKSDTLVPLGNLIVNIFA
uniref:Uncharacterized protein n=1 Tax=Romanomermis culicivorax TaxID=13658 RepID=A0A915KA89_ROMCU